MDGTIIQTIFHHNPRNWLKLWPTAKAGYKQFLDALQDCGVSVHGLVSRRPNFWVIRWVTQKTISRLKLSHYFPPEHIVLAGSDDYKGAFVAEQAQQSPVVMIEDKPYRIGPVIVKCRLQITGHPLTLAVVPHSRAIKYTLRLRERLEHIPGVIVRSDSNQNFSVYSPGRKQALLHVVVLQEYSAKTARTLAKQLYSHV